MKSPITPTAPRAFYVTIRKGTQTIYALGPFKHHRRALGLVRFVRLAISRADLDPWCEFGYGTASLQVSLKLPAGALNEIAHVGADLPCVAGQEILMALIMRVESAMR